MAVLCCRANPVKFRLTNFSFIILLFLQTSLCFAYQKFPVQFFNLNGSQYQLEIADTVKRKRQGLMYREFLAKDDGMLFVYSRPGNHRIWMKNTLVPLTVIWLDSQARIVGIKSLSPCHTPDCPVYGPDLPSKFIIELHIAAHKNFKVGDVLSSILESTKR